MLIMYWCPRQTREDQRRAVISNRKIRTPENKNVGDEEMLNTSLSKIYFPGRQCHSPTIVSSCFISVPSVTKRLFDGYVDVCGGSFSGGLSLLYYK